MIYLFVYGLVFGYAYIKTNSLTMSILCHVLINFLTQITLDSTIINTNTVFYVFIAVSISLFLLRFIISELTKDDRLLTLHLKGIKSGLKTLVNNMSSKKKED